MGNVKRVIKQESLTSGGERYYLVDEDDPSTAPEIEVIEIG